MQVKNLVMVEDRKSSQDENDMPSSGIKQALHKKPTSQGASSSLRTSIDLTNAVKPKPQIPPAN